MPWSLGGRAIREGGAATRLGLLRITLVATLLFAEASIISADEPSNNDRFAWVYAVGKRGAFAYTEDAGRTWATGDTGTTQDLYAISFVDARQGVAVGAGGVIISTVNAGKEWGEATDAVAQGPTLLGVSMMSSGNALVVGEKGLFLTYDAGGDEWSAPRAIECGAAACTLSAYNKSSSTGADLHGVRFKDAVNGLVVGVGALVLVTSDGGESFTPAADKIAGGVRPDLVAIDMEGILGRMVVAGARGAAFLVEPFVADPQNSDAIDFRWEACGGDGCAGEVPVAAGSFFTASDLLAVSLVDESNVLVGGRGGLVATHAGSGFKVCTVSGLASTHNVTGVYMATSQTMMIATDGGAIFWSGDGGSTWEGRAQANLTGLSFLAMAGRNADDLSAGSRPAPSSLLCSLFAVLVTLASLAVATLS